MPISALPTPPSRSDLPQDFSDRADALLGALPGFVTEANALQSDVNAKEASASSYATIATNKAAEAQASATTASTKASEAAASAVAAAAAASNAEIAFDSFDDKYLGSKANDPATDNDGSPLLTGALYWNTTVGAVRVWNGSAWLSMAADASIVDFQQAGTGAVLRTAQDKMREWVSVKDFGAVGDGVADDTSAFAAALAASRHVRIPAGTYLVSQVTLSDVTGYVLEGASPTATVLKGMASSNEVLRVSGTTPGGLNTYNVFKNFSIDMSNMNSVTPAAAIGVSLVNIWGCSFDNINVLPVNTAQRAMLIGQHVYTTVFTNCDFGGTAGLIEIDGFALDITYSTTTLTFIGCSFATCLARLAMALTFVQAIVQGATNKFQLSDVTDVTILGGDIEGTATYLALGAGCKRITSLNNSFIGFAGTYLSGTLVSGSLLDAPGAPQIVTTGSTQPTAMKIDGAVDEESQSPFLTRKKLRNSNAAAQQVDINVQNATGSTFVGITVAGETYIDSRTSNKKVVIQQDGTDRFGVDGSVRLLANTLTAASAGAVVGYLEVVVNGVLRKIPFHAE